MTYQQMAYVYDQFMDDAPYDQWVTFVKKMIQQAHLDVDHIVDLGCGTGEITINLAEAGYHMTGVDLSSEMLATAEQKANYKQQKIHWLKQDLRSLRGLHHYDVAVSLCDVINYITTPREVERVFYHVFQLLRDGGLFIFDVHSLYHVENQMIHHNFSDVTDTSAYIWFCDEGEEPGEMYHDLTFFLKNGSTYERFEETHFQKTFHVDEYKRFLKKAGFRIKGIYSDFSIERNKIPEVAERIFFCAEKTT